MDNRQFDLLAQRLGARRSRRDGIRLLSGVVALFGIRSGLPGYNATAKGKKKKKVTLCHEGQTISVSGKAKKGHLKHGDTLGPCPSPPPGAAGCAVGQKPCQGGCIPSNQCCIDADCAAGAPRCCNGACIRPNECCASSECPAAQVCQGGSCICAPSTVACGGNCCTAPAGLTVARIRCEQPSTCICEVRPSDVCAPGCPPTNTFQVGCDDPDLNASIDDICAEAGCDPP